MTLSKAGKIYAMNTIMALINIVPIIVIDRMRHKDPVHHSSTFGCRNMALCHVRFTGDNDKPYFETGFNANSQSTKRLMARLYSGIEIKFCVIYY